MKFDMIQEDITYGIRCSMTSCPIARTIQRTYKDLRILVSVNEIKIGKDIYLTPLEVQRFIIYFDEKHFVDPVSFELM